MCVTFQRKKRGHFPKLVVDFLWERDTLRNKIMEIVEDFEEKSYNNNGKPWKSSRILRVNPFVFIFLSFFIIFLHFSFFFAFFIFSLFHYSFIFSYFFIFSFFHFFHFLLLVSSVLTHMTVHICRMAQGSGLCACLSDCVIPVSLLIVSMQFAPGHRAVHVVRSTAQPHEHLESGIVCC